MNKYKLILSLLTFTVAMQVYATDFAFSSTSLTIANSTGCATSSYTFSMTTANDKKARHQSGVSTATITFPAGTDATTFTSGTVKGFAITTYSVTATTFTFTFPTNIGKNVSFDIVLNGITNGDGINGTNNASISAGNTSSGVNTGSFNVITTACPTCFDLIQNQDETGVDCGGVCPACPSCSDGLQNQDETGIDCGGVCIACPTCVDGIQNGTETGVDCGGSCAACDATVDLHNVVITNTSSGVNFLSDMVTNVTGTVTLTQGVFTTNGFELYTLNKNTNSISIGNVNSYVNGNLRRKLNPTGSYYLPVGNLTKGYELANINFTGSTQIRSLVARFDDWAPIASPLNEVECAFDYNIDPLDNGFWTITADTLDTTGVYNATLYNRNYTNWTGNDTLTIMRNSGSGYTLRNGDSCRLNPPDTVIRENMYGFSLFATAQGGAVVVLPYHVLSFSGENQGKYNYLYWSTDYEEENEFFYLERSSKMIGWEQIAKVEANKNINGSVYDYIDKKPFVGVNYYRLKKVTKGKAEYSNTIVLNYNEEKVRPKLFPNPTNDVVNFVYIISSIDFDPNIQIYNSLGQIVYNGDLEKSFGSHEVQFDLSQYGADIYLFKISIDNEQFIEKVVVK